MLVTTKNQGISLKFNTNYIDLNFGPYIEERKGYIQKRKRTAVPPDLRPEHRRPHEDDQGIDESEIEVRPTLMRYIYIYIYIQVKRPTCPLFFLFPLASPPPGPSTSDHLALFLMACFFHSFKHGSSF